MEQVLLKKELLQFQWLNNKMKKNKSVSGGILLEVVFMLAIMVAIFPFIQSRAKKRSDAIRNQMVIKDLLKLKSAVELYLKRKPTFKTSLYDVDFDDLYDSGLEKSFQKKNVLGQEYKVRVKTSLDENGDTVYDAIVIATGENSIPTMRIRDIVKEAKGIAGYVDKQDGGNDDMVYGPNWQFVVKPWNVERDDIDTHSIVVKAGLSKKEYKYISRDKDVGSSTMETDLHMNMQSIFNLRDLHIGGFMEVGDFNLTGGDSVGVSEFNDISIGEFEKSVAETEDGAAIGGEEGGEGDGVETNEGKASFSLVDGDMTINGVLRFPLGLTMADLSFADNGLKWFILQESLHVRNDLDFNDLTDCSIGNNDYESSCNKLRFALATNLKIPVTTGKTIMAISNLLEFDASNLENILKINNLRVRSFDSDKGVIMNGDTEDRYALRFSNLYVDGSTNILRVASSANTIGLKDIIVSDVNEKLLSGGTSKKIGGIDITKNTPLTIILRALYYEYGDVYKVVTTEYPSDAFLPWYWILGKRCEYDSNETGACGSGWYY